VYLRNLAISDITQKLGIGQRVRRGANAGVVVENGHQYDSDDRPGKQILGQIVQINFLSITSLTSLLPRATALRGHAQRLRSTALNNAQ
jgi:hypothetical protein